MVTTSFGAGAAYGSQHKTISAILSPSRVAGVASSGTLLSMATSAVTPISNPGTGVSPAAPSSNTRRVSVSSTDMAGLGVGVGGGRRRSTIRPIGTGYLKRLGGAAAESGTAGVRYENTYRMDQDPGTKFSALKVKNLVEKILTANLSEQSLQSSAETNGELAADLSELIKRATKDLGFRRYKLVVNVFLCQNAGQCFVLGSRCIWDQKKDDWVSVEVNTKHFHAVAVVHGCYFE